MEEGARKQCLECDKTMDFSLGILFSPLLYTKSKLGKKSHGCILPTCNTVGRFVILSWTEMKWNFGKLGLHKKEPLAEHGYRVAGFGSSTQVHWISQWVFNCLNKIIFTKNMYYMIFPLFCFWLGLYTSGCKVFTYSMDPFTVLGLINLVIWEFVSGF